MTFWDFVAKSLDWLSDRYTRVLGVAAGTLVTLTGTGIIPDKQLKYYMAAIAILTYWRGSATGKTYQQAKAVLSSNPPVSGSPSGMPANFTQPETPASKESPK